MMPFSRVASSPSAILISTLLLFEPCTGSYVVTTYNTPLNSQTSTHGCTQFEPDYTEPSQADCEQIANDNSKPYTSQAKSAYIGGCLYNPTAESYIYNTYFGGQTTSTWDHLHKVCYGSSSSKVAGDPHLHFAGGRRADFRGTPGVTFALLSAPGVAANVHIEAADFMLGGALIHGTYMTELTIRCGDVLMSHNATNATKWGFGWQATQLRCSPKDAVQNVHPYNARRCGADASVVVRYATATFQCGKWTLSSTVQPVARYVSGASKNLDIKITGSSKAHGLIGQNMDASSSRDGALDVYPYVGEYTTKAQAQGAIDGTYMDYAVSSAFSTEFKYSLFDAKDEGGDFSAVEALSTHTGYMAPSADVAA